MQQEHNHIQQVDWGEFRRRFIESLLKADQVQCLRVVEDLERSQPPEQVIIHVLEGALIEVERVVQRGRPAQYDVGNIMRVVLRCLMQLVPHPEEYERSGKRVTLIPKDSTFAPLYAELLFCLLQCVGWDVDFLAAHTDAATLTAFVRKTDPDAIVVVESLSTSWSSEDAPLSAVLSELGADVQVWSCRQRSKRDKHDDSASFYGHCIGLQAQVAALDRLLAGSPTYEQYRANLGKQIRRLRKERKLSQEELSRQATLNRAFLSSIENAKVNPSLNTLYKLSEILGVPLHKLLEAGR